PGTSGRGSVAHRGAAAEATPEHLAGQPGLPADSVRLPAASHRAAGVHGAALHVRRRGRGVLAVAAPVDEVDLLRVPGTPAHLLGLAGRPGLDRRLPAAAAQPATDWPA